MKALVTGFPGWLGTRLTDILRARGRQTRSLSLPMSDLTKPHTLEGICDGIKTVFHCAGVIHPRRVSELFLVNTYGTENLIKEAVKAGVENFIYVSSNSVGGYNTSRGAVMKEEDPPRPYKKYGLSKYKAEEIVKSYYKKGVIKTVIIRPCWYYGPNQPERQTRFFRMIKSGRPIMFGDGNNLRSMSYIDNVAEALLLAEERKEAGGEVYWVSDKVPYTTLQIYRTIAGLLKVKIRPRYLPAFVSGTCEFADDVLQSAGLYSPEIHVAGEMAKDIACSIEKAERGLGYDPKIELEEGMRRSIDWCRKNGIEI